VRARTDLPADVIDGQVFRLLKDLAVLGALEFAKRPSGSAPAREDDFRRGEAALRRGDPAAAEPLLARAALRRRGGAWARALLGEARRHLGRPEAALADLDAAVAALPAEKLERAMLEDRLRLLRAKLHLARGDHAAARRDADAALASNARHSEALVVRAKAALALGDLARAKSDLEAAQAIESGRKGQG
jgi:tetratricopeptide (TPR) repeat protein